MEKKNILYIDILKIIASIAVVAIHICAIKWYSIEPISKSWQVLNIYNSTCRWAVPIFIMASGVLLLNPNKKITIKEIYLKYIKKIVILIIVWQIIYALVPYINCGFKLTIGIVLDKFFASHYHLWYLYMLVGLYIITPIIKKIIEKDDDKIIEYFLMLWCIFQLLVPMLNTVIYGNPVNMSIPNFGITMIMGYVGYYILGYYISKKQCKKKTKMVIYAFSMLCLIAIIAGTSIIKIKANTRFTNEFFYDYLTFPICICSLAVFIFIKNICNKFNLNDKTEKLIKKIVNLTLGIYLIHPMIIIIFEKLGIDLLKWNVLISVPLATLVVYSLSMFLIFILSKIPLVGKYIA